MVAGGAVSMIRHRRTRARCRYERASTMLTSNRPVDDHAHDQFEQVLGRDVGQLAHARSSMMSRGTRVSSAR